VNVLVWVQSNLFVWDYGPMDGRAIDWAADLWIAWLEASVWLSALLVAIVGFRQLNRPMVRIAVILFFLQTALFGYNWFTSREKIERQSEATDIAEVRKQIHRFSSKNNIVHIIADGFQSDVFAELVEEGEMGNRLKAALEGFTFFREHMGVFPYTHMTVPAIMSGAIYRNRRPIEEHMAAALEAKTILSVARDAGYEIDVMAPEGILGNMYERTGPTHFFPISNRHHVSRRDLEIQAAARLADLTLFRVSPHFVKSYIYNDQLWLLQSRLVDKEYMNLPSFSSIALLRNLYQAMSADRSTPVYKLIHVWLSHNPMVTTRHCTYAGRVLPTVRGTVKNQARCGLVEVANLFEEMKRLGIYRDATIVLMGDHGAWVTPTDIKAVPNSDGRTASVIAPQIMALAVPLLAIKRPGDEGPLRVSDAPTWIVDTAATIADIAGLEAAFNGTSIFKLDDDGQRERKLYYYRYKPSEYTDEYLSPIEEFVVKGSVFDSSSWRYVSTHLPGGGREHSRTEGSLWRIVPLQ
jgi:hypothetical protein